MNISTNVRIRTIVSMLLIATMAMFVGCKKDETYLDYSVSLAQKSIIVGGVGESSQVAFTTKNISRVELESAPKGWTVTVDFAKRIITATAPASLEGGNVAYGVAKFRAFSTEDHLVNLKLNVSIVSYKELPSSNSYIMNDANTCYVLSALQKGETDQAIAPASVGIVWLTSMDVVRYFDFKDGKIYVLSGATTTDDTRSVTPGNALVAAYDAAGNVLWSWHLWFVDYDPETKNIPLSNGDVLMSYNLGASASGSSSQDEILNSYGLFYQWGRKEPFVGPQTYNGASSLDHTLYNVNSREIYINYTPSTAEIGTQDYATAHPLTYITGVKESGYNWLFSDISTGFWGETKTINDPCPKGWRVSSADTFDAMTIEQPFTAAMQNLYGYNIVDGSTTFFMNGGGRRGYLNGYLSNINSNDEHPSPWSGYYWSAGSDVAGGIALWFDYVLSGGTATGHINSQYTQYEATGMQVRCVKE